MSDLNEKQICEYGGRRIFLEKCSCAGPCEGCPAWRAEKAFKFIVDRAEKHSHIGPLRCVDLLNIITAAANTPAPLPPAHKLTLLGPGVSSKNARRILFKPSGVPFVAPDVKVRFWMKDAARQLSEQWGERPPLDGDLRVDLEIYLGPRQRLDTDNAASSVLDALERGGVIVNDNRISELKARRHKTDRKNPRVEIQIREIES